MGQIYGLDKFQICGTCLRLHDVVRTSLVLQTCRCHRKRDDPKWSGYDFNESEQLCECCLREVMPNGNRFSHFFCESCRARVTAFNDALRCWLIPIGRHSFMARTYDGGARGVMALPTTVAVQAGTDPAARDALNRFVGGMNGLFDRQARLHVWAGKRLATVLGLLGFTLGEHVLLLDYLATLAVAEADDERFSRESAFSTLTTAFRPAPGDAGVWVYSAEELKSEGW